MLTELLQCSIPSSPSSMMPLTATWESLVQFGLRCMWLLHDTQSYLFLVALYNLLEVAQFSIMVARGGGGENGEREKGVSRVINSCSKFWTFSSNLRARITETHFRFQSCSWFSCFLRVAFRCFYFGVRIFFKSFLRSEFWLKTISRECSSKGWSWFTSLNPLFWLCIFVLNSKSSLWRLEQ